jgi:GWxTD domain-containing protein
MKKVFSVLVLMVSFLHSHAGGSLSVQLSHCAFNTPDNKPYIETYLSVLGASATYKKNSTGNYQACIEVGMSFLQGNDIKAFRKYVLYSPELKDTLNPPSFIDQQRFSLPNGEYMLEFKVSDKNKPASHGRPTLEPIKIDFNPQTVNVSGIELVESYTKAATQGQLTKNGYDLVPYISTAYLKNMDKVVFYSEIYNARKVLGENEPFIVLYYLETLDDAHKLDNYGGHLKATTQDVNIVFPEINIAELPSGNYNIVVEVHDKTNQIVAYNKVFLQRINPKQTTADVLAAIKADPANSWIAKVKGKDSLVELIRCLRPISGDVDVAVAEDVVKRRDVKEMQRYILGFWNNFDVKDPEGAFTRYNEQVVAIQHSYGTMILRGYNTDRGRVYLKYGMPSVKQVMDKEPSAYPYEIWTYYKLPDNQRNRKFVFYDPDFASNNYILIHSDAIGEIYDANWELRLRKRDTQTNNFDTQQGVDHFGGNAAEDFDHPK